MGKTQQMLVQCQSILQRLNNNKNSGKVQHLLDTSYVASQMTFTVSYLQTLKPKLMATKLQVTTREKSKRQTANKTSAIEVF